MAAALLVFAPWPRLPMGLPGLPWGLPWGLHWPLLLFALLAGLARLGGPALAAAWARRLLLVVGPLLVSLVLVQGLFFPGAREVIASLGPLELKAEGLRFAAVVGGRVLVVVGAALLLTLSTHPADLAAALGEAGVPSELGYIVLAALLLGPRLEAQGRGILEAQQARGLILSGGLLGRARALPSLFGPLALAALQEAQARAAVLDARALRALGPKTRLRLLADSPAERALRRLLVGSSLVVFVLGHALRWGS